MWKIDEACKGCHFRQQKRLYRRNQEYCQRETNEIGNGDIKVHHVDDSVQKNEILLRLPISDF